MRKIIQEMAGIDTPPTPEKKVYTQSQTREAFNGIVRDYLDFMKRIKELDFSKHENIKIIIDELEDLGKLSKDYNIEIKLKRLPEFIKLIPDTITPQIKTILINKLKKYGQFLKLEQDRLKKEENKPVSQEQKNKLLNKLGG